MDFMENYLLKIAAVKNGSPLLMLMLTNTAWWLLFMCLILMEFFLFVPIPFGCMVKF